MNSILEKAKERLISGEYTCVACNGDIYIESSERGVKPLLDFIDSGTSLAEFSVADRIIGKAAAFLYIKLKAKEIYAGVISRPAVELLNENNVPVCFGEQVDYIINRTKTGLCPMEESVLDSTDVEDAERKIRAKLAALKAGN
jgi:Domain of unknown function (DUF1893).